ncbi:protein ITPRID1 isoform X4 [Amia ocellicauda]|uniref:protein ITPRID1 isoform X4 n=1 Tax=Amia ocellicauda TaxID=2972642 RepID=UPI0034638AE6
MMCTGCNLDKRANLTSSKELWPEMDEQQPPQTLSNNKPGDDKQDSIRQWLISSCTLDAKQDTVQCTEQAGSLKRLASAEDDLFLGVEASLYGKNTNYKTVHEYLRSLKPSLGRPVLSRWNSVTSAFSANSGIVSIMDVLDFRHDDPEELLLDLGFGTEEPDIAIKIPARFINYQSKARGINIQIFLQAQKMRMDIENPDFTNRFRELEVLQQVTSAFSSLFNNLSGDKQQQVPVSKKADAGEMNTPAVQEKRRKLGMLFRRASKKTLSLAKSMQEPPSALQIPGTESSADPLQDRRTLFKCSRPCLPENACLSPLAEEQSPAGEKSSVYFPDDDFSPAPMSSECPPLLQDRGEPHQQTSEVLLRQRAAKEPRCVTGSSMRRRSAGDRQTPESFEMEEIQSFDEGSITGPGMEEKIEGFAIRTNSCQSDSSGFLEEPSVPSRLQQASPATEYAMDELEGMIRSLRQFRETLTDIEEQLANEQASVYNILSDNEKEEVRYIQDLRNAVKEEVNELELQLADLAHNSDDGFKMQMNRLMDEQSFLHLHLKTQHSGLSSQSNLITKSTRSVSTQCSLLPEIQFPDMLHLHEAARAPDFPQCTGDRARHPAGNINTTKDDININTTESSVKAFVKHEKVDFSTFLQNLKDSLQQSFNSDSLK